VSDQKFDEVHEKINILNRKYNAIDKRTLLLKQMREDDRQNFQNLFAHLGKINREISEAVAKLKNNTGSKKWMYFVRFASAAKYLFILIAAFLLYIHSPEKAADLILSLVSKLIK